MPGGGILRQAQDERIGFLQVAAFRVMPPTPLMLAEGQFIASPGQLFARAQAAGEGDWCVYARAAYLPARCAVGEMARGLAKRWLLTLAGRRSPGDPGLWEYCARRSCRDPNAAKVAPPAPVLARVRDQLTDDARRVLEMLERRADLGAPCPGNREIARACGLKDAEAAAYQLRSLSTRGFIIRELVPLVPGRVVTIVETGVQTGVQR